MPFIGWIIFFVKSDGNLLHLNSARTLCSEHGYRRRGTISRLVCPSSVRLEGISHGSCRRDSKPWKFQIMSSSLLLGCGMGFLKGRRTATFQSKKFSMAFHPSLILSFFGLTLSRPLHKGACQRLLRHIPRPWERRAGGGGVKS